MNNEPEIFVHISASATRQNDDLYRSLANAYLQFEPCNTIPDGSPSSSHRTANVVSNVTTSKDSYGSFPSHIESEDRSTSQNQADAQMSSSVDDDSQLPTSRLGQLERIHARWKQTTSRPSLASVQRSSTGAPLSSALADGAFIDDTQLAYQAIESQLPDNLSATSEDTSDDESRIVRTPLEALTGNRQATEDTTRREVPPLLKSFEPSPAPRAVTSRTIIRSDVLPDVSKSQEKSSAPAPLGRNFQDLAIEVYPPAPTVTVQAPKTLPSQITRFLATLKEQNPNRFKPRKKVRVLSQDERGHWSVDCSPWPHTAQFEFWSSLSEHVGSGSLGWGVTLHRESLQSRHLGLVRLYCWGEIVEHTWLALWLCSKGKISDSGSKWVDAGESMVIEVSQS